MMYISIGHFWSSDPRGQTRYRRCVWWGVVKCLTMPICSRVERGRNSHRETPPPQQSIVNHPGVGTASPSAFPSTRAEEQSQNCVCRSSIAPARRRFTFRVTLYARRKEALRQGFVDHRSSIALAARLYLPRATLRAPESTLGLAFVDCRSPWRRRRFTSHVLLYACRRALLEERPSIIAPSVPFSTRFQT